MFRAPRPPSGRSPESKAADRWRSKNDPIRRWYDTARWARFTVYMLDRNPMCQRIFKGEQCRNGATTVHHLLSPRQRPDLFLEPKNVVCLCAHCHPGGTEGTPEWVSGVDYVPTVIWPPTLGITQEGKND